MELDRALTQISEIHAQVLRSEVFRGYRSVPMAITGALALAAAGLQELAFPAETMGAYVIWWIGVAIASAAVCAFDLWLQIRDSALTARLQRTGHVLVQFLPAVLVGAGFAIVLAGTPHSVLLPGLWAAAFGLGVFSSRPYLPRAIGWVAAFYGVAGLVNLSLSQLGVVPTGWAMGLTFGFGQVLLAVVLHINLERKVRRPEGLHG